MKYIKSLLALIIASFALSLTACEDKFDGETISKYSELGQCMLGCYEKHQGPAPEEIRIVE